MITLMYDYVTKPFDLDDLAMRVAKALERRKLTIENREYSYRLEQKVRQQTEQMQQYYRESVEALSREQIAIEELHTVRGTQPGETASGAEVALKSHESSGSVKEFAKKLSQLFNKGTPGLGDEDERSYVKSANMAGMDEESPEGKGGLALYQGIVELSLHPPLSLQQIWQLYEHLKLVPQLKALNIIGSVERDVKIRLVLETPAPLLKFLRELIGDHGLSVMPKPLKGLVDSGIGGGKVSEVPAVVIQEPVQHSLLPLCIGLTDELTDKACNPFSHQADGFGDRQFFKTIWSYSLIEGIRYVNTGVYKCAIQIEDNQLDFHRYI